MFTFSIMNSLIVIPRTFSLFNECDEKRKKGIENVRLGVYVTIADGQLGIYYHIPFYSSR